MRYVDGFVLPVPKKNLQTYRRMAQEGGRVYREHGESRSRWRRLWIRSRRPSTSSAWSTAASRSWSTPSAVFGRRFSIPGAAGPTTWSAGPS